MGRRNRGKRPASVEDDKGGRSSKRQRKATHEKVEEMWVSSSFGSEYMAQESRGESTTRDTVSLEVESDCGEEVSEPSGSEMQRTRSRRAKFRSSVPKLEAVWKGLEEAGLMDLSGSDSMEGVMLVVVVVQMCQCHQSHL